MNSPDWGAWRVGWSPDPAIYLPYGTLDKSDYSPEFLSARLFYDFKDLLYLKNYLLLLEASQPSVRT